MKICEKLNALSREIAELKESKRVFRAHEEHLGEWSELIRIADEQIKRKKNIIKLLKGKKNE